MTTVPAVCAQSLNTPYVLSKQPCLRVYFIFIINEFAARRAHRGRRTGLLPSPRAKSKLKNNTFSRHDDIEGITRFAFSQNQLLKSTDDQHIGILKNKIYLKILR